MNHVFNYVYVLQVVPSEVREMEIRTFVLFSVVLLGKTRQHPEAKRA